MKELRLTTACSTPYGVTDNIREPLRRQPPAAGAVSAQLHTESQIISDVLGEDVEDTKKRCSTPYGVTDNISCTSGFSQ